MKNLYHSMQFLYNQVSDVIAGVLMNVQIDRTNISREQENFARNHWPIIINDPEAGYCVIGFS